MFNFYKINISENDFEDFKNSIDEYEKAMRNNKNQISRICDFKITNEEDGNKIQANWFPEIKADVFISHSHADKQLAKALGGYIFQNTNLKSFIDSEVWGYSDELLRHIDNSYCIIKNKNLYDYELRNCSTSHIHMMLSVALMQMISKCRYFIFLDTPNSNENNNTLIKDNYINKTNSPWIYNELMITKMLKSYEPKFKYFSQESRKPEIPISYKIDTKHLKEVNLQSLIEKLKTGGNNNV